MRAKLVRLESCGRTHSRASAGLVVGAEGERRPVACAAVAFRQCNCAAPRHPRPCWLDPSSKGGGGEDGLEGAQISQGGRRLSRTHSSNQRVDAAGAARQAGAGQRRPPSGLVFINKDRARVRLPQPPNGARRYLFGIWTKTGSLRRSFEA
jgi:hypothetical protein